MLFLKNRKLLVDIVTIFATLFIILSLAIMVYFYRQSSQAILNVGDSLMSNSNQSTIIKLNEFFSPAPLVKIAEYVMQDKMLKDSEMHALEAYMHIILDSYPELNNAYLADVYGNMFIENRVSKYSVIPFVDPKRIPINSKYISQIVKHDKDQTVITVTYKDLHGQVIKREKDKIEYNSLERPWFVGAKKLNQKYWLGIYQFIDSDKQGVTISYAIKNKNQLLGVVAADLSNETISEEMQKYSISDKGILLLINQAGEIIGGKEGGKLTPYVTSISQVNNPIVSAAFKMHLTLSKDNFNFDINGVRYVAHFTQYAFGPTASWEVMRILPMDTFIGPLKRANLRVEIFTFFMLLLSLLLVMLFAHRISKPIIQLAKETKEMVKLEKPQKSNVKSHIYEIQTMVDALSSTKLALYSFIKYVPKVLVEQLLLSKRIAQLGGEKKELTILFTDIANFTTISEHMEPELLMIHISDYLNVLTQCIQNHHGNVDKYIGDSIMAFWGAPLDDPNQIANACLAVLACQHEVTKMNEVWKNENKPILHTRFGLNAGRCIVGNMGSLDRLNYTTIGDTVNIAARLEGLNKTYSTEIIVSDIIYSAAKNKFLFRPLDIVKIRGKKSQTTIYELIGLLDPNSDFPVSKEQIDICKLSSDAFDAYHQQNFEAAKKLFKELIELHPRDGMAALYLKRL